MSTPFKPTPNKDRGPKCPNHLVPLEEVPSPPPKKGEGVCPISRCRFDYEVDTQDEVGETEYEKNAAGELVPKTKYRVEGEE